MFGVGSFVEVTLPGGARLGGTIRYTDGRQLLVTYQPEEGITLQAGMPVALAQMVHDGLYQIKTAVFCCQKNGLVVPLLPPQLIQRRRSKRLECYLSAWILSETETQPKEPVQVCDISMGGFKCYLYSPVAVGSIPTLEIELGEETSLSVSARVLRCVRRAGGSGQEFAFQAGMQFHHISRLHQIHLHRFLLKHLEDPLEVL